MIRATVLVPLRDNDGQAYELTDWREMEVMLLRFGGYTKAGVVEGAWTADGKVYRDESQQYVVALGTWGDLPRWLDLVAWVRRRFRQEAVYTEVAGIPEIIGE